MVGYTESFWHTFNNGLAFDKSNEEREDDHNKNRRSLLEAERKRVQELKIAVEGELYAH